LTSTGVYTFILETINTPYIEWLQAYPILQPVYVFVAWISTVRIVNNHFVLYECNIDYKFNTYSPDVVFMKQKPVERPQVI